MYSLLRVVSSMLPALEISAAGELTESLPSQEEPGAMKQCHLLSKTKEQQQSQASKQTKKKKRKQNKKRQQEESKKWKGRFQLKVLRNRSCKLAQD